MSTLLSSHNVMYLNDTIYSTKTGNATHYNQVSTCNPWISNAGQISVIWATMF